MEDIAAPESCADALPLIEQDSLLSLQSYGDDDELDGQADLRTDDEPTALDSLQPPSTSELSGRSVASHKEPPQLKRSRPKPLLAASNGPKPAPTLTYRQQLALAMQESAASAGCQDGEEPDAGSDAAESIAEDNQKTERRREKKPVARPSQCCFCRSTDPLEQLPTEELATDSLLHIHDDKSGAYLVAHEECLLYASGLEWERRPGVDVPFNPVHKEVLRARRLRCAVCKLNGASVGCINERCRRCFHLPCWQQEWAQGRGAISKTSCNVTCAECVDTIPPPDQLLPSNWVPFAPASPSTPSKRRRTWSPGKSLCEQQSDDADAAPIDACARCARFLELLPAVLQLLDDAADPEASCASCTALPPNELASLMRAPAAVPAASSADSAAPAMRFGVKPVGVKPQPSRSQADASAPLQPPSSLKLAMLVEAPAKASTMGTSALRACEVELERVMSSVRSELKARADSAVRNGINP